MANSKRKCAYCKERQPAETMLINGSQAFCSKEHFIEYAVSNRRALSAKGKQVIDKEERTSLRKRKEALRDRSWYMKEAQKWFNRFVRLRDVNKPCISCLNPLRNDVRLKGHLYDAGHYLSVGARFNLRFNEDNCHAQCVKCNRDLSGNAAAYRVELVKRIGFERVELLECDHKPKKYTIDDLKEIIAKYKLKCKELE